MNYQWNGSEPKSAGPSQETLLTLRSTRCQTSMSCLRLWTRSGDETTTVPWLKSQSSTLTLCQTTKCPGNTYIQSGSETTTQGTARFLICLHDAKLHHAWNTRQSGSEPGPKDYPGYGPLAFQRTAKLHHTDILNERSWPEPAEL